MTLKGILNIAPDILPCDLSVIMHARCKDVCESSSHMNDNRNLAEVARQVFIYRTRLYPDNAIDDSPVFQQTLLVQNHIFSECHFTL
jgi:hypothetical protein